ncbi:histidine kinase [Leptodesmis sichuanensis]|uniref:histidine kinase n=1 Tax=Leptodesmis sichuanensis TaxID=2906798 RepID=UPI001F36E3FB|nr:histidine kinase [Leptodesmis sichuanensis]UIE38782.1 histidine kinase [Leptodesmis sichuanensis A121]
MQVSPGMPTNADTPLQLLLFVDKRPSSKERIRQVRTALKELREECDFELQIIDVSEQPYLAEYFRLIATPTLIKIHPEPRQSLAGSNLVEQLQHWWPHWQRSVADYLSNAGFAEQPQLRSLDRVRPGGGVGSETESSPTFPAASLTSAADLPTSDLISKELAAAEAVPVNDLPPDVGTDVASESEMHQAVKSITHSAELLRLSDEIFQLRREKEELEHQLQFKDQIIAMLAHDLRNPLTAASIALETLEMGYNSFDENGESRLTPALTAQLLKHARTQTRAIDRMITDILQAARGASSELQIQPQKLDLGMLCTDVLEHLRHRFQSKAQRVEQDIPSDLPVIFADGERIRQVLINLLENAIKYTPVGGTIQLAVLHRTSQKVQVSVCDNGPGIPLENQEQIFEDRFRLKRDEDKEGYGIGLSLCQRIVRAHYGQIWVDSTPNKGSCFHFTLPVFRG